MFKLASFAALVGSAAAFAPAQTGRVATDLAVSELELGVTEPLGVYDPLGWLETEPEAFERRRAVERKHGRVAMAAFVGYIMAANYETFGGALIGYSYPPSECHAQQTGCSPPRIVSQRVAACGASAALSSGRMGARHRKRGCER